ncbi:MAG: 3D-(3,5/4)-trihydroxycyclohexane-1,2-dione acylhydrolase (decyclizing) [Caldilineaceae bacterium]|nr:3D-(3,5/4)-trihydroxycyclohexane-1,2-dione acylhydrolase (decyclizing) [Caldilineaceae bacterium]MDE0337261.1 3D-(3,5/4)-trihydroxycyclohexane-1,2-dione acylhydrolase (decyclizing) [Caldilineaceae bacterium]
MNTERLTMAQAIVRFLKNQYSERDGVEQPFFGGCFGIFGHGNVAGIGQALQQYPDFRYYQTRNEQAMVHTAAAYAKHSNRMRTLACTSSIGPGASNMVTGAATATINRLPVLILPGDIFARRNVAPVLQQLESEHSQDISVNDCFKPVSRYWDRINRPDQLTTSLIESMRVLTSPADTGAVTLSIPQDVQTEAHEYPAALFEKRVWSVPRNRPDLAALQRAAATIRNAKKPLIIAGGGVLYSEATAALREFVDRFGIPVAETMAGKGSLPYDHPLQLGAAGATGTFAAEQVADEADVVIGIGTRYSDFTTSSKTAFKHPDVQFVNINVAEFDAYKHCAVPLVGDARVTLEELSELLGGYRNDDESVAQAQRLHDEWEAEVQRNYDTHVAESGLPYQGALIGAVNEHGDPDAVMVGAAGSLPGDMHKLWRARHSKQYHLEYGYSCMGYEIAGGLGIKMAEPDREVYVMVGDGSYLMMNTDLITSIQEGYKLTVILMDNTGFRSIGSLSRSLGQDGFGTRYIYPDQVEAAHRNGQSYNGLPTDESGYDVDPLPVDLAMNAESLGCHVIRCQSVSDVVQALQDAKSVDRTTVIYVPDDRYLGVQGYSWWDVPVAEVSELDSVNAAREEWEEMRTQERYYI